MNAPTELTDQQKADILQLKRPGLGSKLIARAMGLPENLVRNFLNREKRRKGGARTKEAKKTPLPVREELRRRLDGRVVKEDNGCWHLRKVKELGELITHVYNPSIDGRQIPLKKAVLLAWTDRDERDIFENIARSYCRDPLCVNPEHIYIPSVDDLLERVEKYTNRNEKGCWIWPYKRTRNNAPHHPQENRVLRRELWEHIHGEPFPDGRWAVARCGERLCVNPDHFAPMKPGAVRKYNDQGNRERAEKIIAAIAKGDRPQKEIANDFGIDEGTISKIKNGVVWPDLDRPDEWPSHNCWKGRERRERAERIIRKFADGMERKKIAKEEGVSYGTVRSIINGDTWSGLERPWESDISC